MWKTAVDVAKTVVERFVEDKVPRLAAALAYYTVFAIAPVLVIVIGVASMVFGEDAAQGKLVAQIEDLIGRDGAQLVQTLLANSAIENSGLLPTLVGVGALVLGATTVFIELQDSLNTIWGVKPKPGRGIKGMLRDRILSFGMVVGVGFLLMVSLVVSAVISAAEDWLARVFTDEGTLVLLRVAQIAVSLVVFTILIAAIYKALPDAKIGWRDVLVGAAITAVLFAGGKYLIGLYLGQSSVGSTYGAAGSLAVLLVWLYYSALIFFVGAELTEVYANRWGNHVEPSKNAVFVGRKTQIAMDGAVPDDEEAQAKQRASRLSE